MTGLGARGWLVLVAAAVAGLSWGLVGGVPLARMAIALTVVIVTGSALSRWPRVDADQPPPYRSGRVAPPTGYPRYEEILRMIRWAASSPTYTERVLQPWLDELTRDLGIDPPARAAPNAPDRPTTRTTPSTHTAPPTDVGEVADRLERALHDRESGDAAR